MKFKFPKFTSKTFLVFFKSLDLYDYLLVLALVISAIIRFWQVRDFNFAFTFDQARDMLEIRPMAYFLDLKLTGPTTSITGLLLGPFYYYFNLPAFWISGGSPQFLTNWNIIAFLASGIIIYLVLRRHTRLGAFFIILFYLLSPQLFVITSYFWNANAAVYIAGFYFLSLYLYSKNASLKNVILLGLFAALTMQFEAAFGVVCVGYAFFIVLLRRNISQIKYYLLVTIPFFIPQLLFELWHNFPMTKYFIDSFNPTTSVLGVKTPIAEVAKMHYIGIKDMFEGQLMLPYGYGFYFWVATFFVTLVSRKYRNVAFYFLGFIIFSYIFYVAIYHHALKLWYLQGFRIWYLFIFGLGLALIINFIKNTGWKTVKTVLLLMIFAFLIRNFYLVLEDKFNVILASQQSNDPKNARNMITTIDWVYEQSKRESFEAYSYVPEVYDYPYLYLYWWHGNNKYGYTPTVASYSLADVPVYANMEEEFIKSTGGGKTDKIALVYEKKATYRDWLNQFSGYCVISRQEFFWPVVAEWREKCSYVK